MPDEPTPKSGAFFSVFFFGMMCGVIVGIGAYKTKLSREISQIQSQGKAYIDGMDVCRLGCRSDNDITCERFLSLIKGTR